MSVGWSESPTTMSGPFASAAVGFLVLCLMSTSTATDGPVSVTTLEGRNALFHCNGSGTVLIWKVDGLPHNDQNIVNRGITDNTTSSSSGTVQSTLTVPATSVNNGTTVQCFIGSSLFSLSVVGNYSTLTILSSIGPVLKLELESSFSAVLWDPPATAGVLSGLSYIVIVMNNNTGQVIVSATTTNTNYPLPVLQPCQYYTANVTAFSSEHHSDSVVTGQRTPGDNYKLTSLSDPMVASYNLTHCAIYFTVNIESNGKVACPDQNLMLSVTKDDLSKEILAEYEKDNITDGEMQYEVFIKSGFRCLSEVKITNEGKEVQMKLASFSSYNVQGCVVSTDHTSILVECTFAINSNITGIVVIQDDQSQYTINKTLQRLQQDSDKGSVTITGLPAGEYNVSVYDQMENVSNNNSQSAAYQHNESLHITYSGGNAGSSPTPSLSITTPATDSSIAAVIAGCLAAVAIIILVVAFVGVLCLYVKKHKQKTVPMENNTQNIYTYSNGNGVLKVTHIISDEHDVTLAEPAYMQTRREFLPPTSAGNDPPTTPSTDNECPQKKSDPVYAALQHPAREQRPVAPPPPEQVPVQYADIQLQQQQGPVYADLQHSTNAPAPPLPIDPVHYATMAQGNTESQLHASSVAFTQNSIAEANSPTSDYYSGETESHRSATKISDQSSSDSAETKADGIESYCRESEDCTDNGGKAAIVNKQTTPAPCPTNIEDARFGDQHKCYWLTSETTGLLDHYGWGATQIEYSLSCQAETSSDTATSNTIGYNTSKGSASSNSDRQYHQYLIHQGCHTLPIFSANWAATDHHRDQSYTPDRRKPVHEKKTHKGDRNYRYNSLPTSEMV